MAALAVAIPLLAAALVAGAGRRLPRRAADLVAIGAALATLGLSLTLLGRTAGALHVEWPGGWAVRGGLALGVALAVDPLGAGLAALGAVLVVAALVFSVRYFEDVHGHFQALVLLFLGGLTGFAVTGDLFDLFVFFELMGVAAFALAGYKIEEASAVRGAISFAVTNTVAAVLILFGIAILYGWTGTLDLAQIGRALPGAPPRLVAVAFTLVTAGLMVKAAVVPFHFWLPDAHAVAPTPVSVLFSGAMVEAGVYGIVRVHATAFAPAMPASAGGILVGAGAISALVGAVLCLAQRHLKRLLAFSTVSHAGLILAGAGLLSPRALAGAAVYVLGHGLVKGALFLCAGMVLHRLRSVDEIALRGRGRGMWGTASLFAVGALGLAGLPPFGTFLGEAEMEDAARELGRGWLGLVAAVAGALTAAAVLRATGRVFLGLGPAAPETRDVGGESTEEPETRRSREPVPATMWIPTTALLLLALALGVAPGLRSGAERASGRALDGKAYAAAVLDGAPSPPAPAGPERPVGAALARALATAGAAIALAAAMLARERLPGALRRGASVPWNAVVVPLRRAHDGRVGGYVVWLAAGVALLGAVTLRLVAIAR